MPKAIIIFDGVCHLCQGSVQFIIQRDPKQQFMFTALQSSAAKILLEQYQVKVLTKDSIVLIQDNRCYYKSAAALTICKQLSAGWPVLYLFKFIPRPIRDVLYSFIAKHRYRFFGKSKLCMRPSAQLRRRFLQ